MRLALLGYGRMGHEIESIALAGGHEIVVRTDISSRDLFNPLTASTCDVAMEFTGPESAADTILRALSYGVPVVSGSTGWLARMMSWPDTAGSRGEHSYIHQTTASASMSCSG